VIRHHQRRHRTAATRFARSSIVFRPIARPSTRPSRVPSADPSRKAAVTSRPSTAIRTCAAAASGNRDFDERLSSTDDVGTGRHGANRELARVRRRNFRREHRKGAQRQGCWFRLIISSPGVDGSVTLGAETRVNARRAALHLPRSPVEVFLRRNAPPPLPRIGSRKRRTRR